MPEKTSDTFKTTQSDMSAVASDTEKMLDEARQKGAERYAAAREKLREQWAEAKDDLDHLRQKAVDYSQSAARATNTFAHDHPWTTAGAAVGVGALIGWLVSRRTDMPRSSR